MICSLDHEVRVKMFGNVSQKCGGWHNGVRMPHNVILYCIDGEFCISVEDRVFRVEKGDILFIPANTFYKPLDGGKCQYYFFHFAATMISEMENNPKHIITSPHAGVVEGYGYTFVSTYRSGVNIRTHIKNVPYHVKSIFERAEKLCANNTEYSNQLLLDNLLRELIIFMGRNKTTTQNIHLAKMLKHIEQNFSGDLSLSALSVRFGLSKSYIARLFREQLCCKPSEYVNNLRISIANTMLYQTNMTVSEIAEKVGYSNVYYFSRIFKQIVGCSPINIRK